MLCLSNTHCAENVGGAFLSAHVADMHAEFVPAPCYSTCSMGHGAGHRAPTLECRRANKGKRLAWSGLSCCQSPSKPEMNSSCTLYKQLPKLVFMQGSRIFFLNQVITTLQSASGTVSSMTSFSYSPIRDNSSSFHSLTITESFMLLI